MERRRKVSPRVRRRRLLPSPPSRRPGGGVCRVTRLCTWTMQAARMMRAPRTISPRQSLRPEMPPRLMARTPPWREPALPTACTLCGCFCVSCLCVYSVSPCVRVGRLVSHPFFGPLWRGRACCVSHVLRVLSCLFSLQLLFALVVLLNTSLVLFCFYSLETLLSTEYRYVCARVHVTGVR